MKSDTLVRFRGNPSAISRPAGFTLIEVMVTVAIIGILSAIALPSYTDYVRRGRIPEATSNLAGIQVRMEQWYQDQKSYYPLGATSGCGVTPLPTIASGVAKFFDITCATSGGGSSYVLTATGAGSMTGFKYTIDQDGTRASVVSGVSTAWDATKSACWIINKGGAC